MRRMMRWMLLSLAAVLLLLAVYHGLKRLEPSSAPQGMSSAALGMVLLEAEDGVYVLAVSDQSPAHQAGLAPGDYILQMDGQAIGDAAELDALLCMKTDSLRLTVRRGEQELSLVMPCR